MKEITAVKINPTDFAPFGTYCSMTEPEGYPLQGEIHKFYPDRISGTCMGSMGFSPIAVRKDERIVKMAEYHTTTWEGIVALDDHSCCSCICRYASPGTYKGLPCSQRMYGKDQCRYLAFMSSASKQRCPSCNDHFTGMYLCQ